MRYKVTLPNGKSYTYGPGKAAQAHALAQKTGGKVQVIGQRPSKVCICGRPEEDHDPYDCHRDYRLTGGW